MPGIQWAGRSWRFSPDDLFVIALIALILVDLPINALSLAVFFLGKSLSYPELCTLKDQSTMTAICVFAIFNWILFTMTDMFLIIISYRTPIFTHNSNLVIMLYFRFVLFVCSFLFSIVSAIIMGQFLTPCMNPHGHNLNYEILLTTTYGLIWIHNIGILCVSCCCSQKKHGNSQKSWERRLKRCCCLECLTYSTDQSEAMSAISHLFSTFFQLDDPVMSDIAVGLKLVSMAQHEQLSNGISFCIPYGEDPEMHRRPIKKRKKNAATIALDGMQPKLSEKDLRHVREAKHFSKFMLGLYGWANYMLTDICCCLRCIACGSKAPGRGCGYTFSSDQLENMVGSGCHGTKCCCCSACSRSPLTCSCSHMIVNTFLYKTGIDSSDLLFISLSNEVGRPVYCVCVDRNTLSLVIVIRGTMSISDTVTDIYATCSSCPAEYGLEKYYAHEGMMISTNTIMRALIKSQIVHNFLNKNPSFNIRILGHSLGAGIATLLTTFMIHSKDFEEFSDKIHCITYAPPPIISPELAQKKEVMECITSICYNNDLVPRLSLVNIMKIRSAMVNLRDNVDGSACKLSVLRSKSESVFHHNFDASQVNLYKRTPSIQASNAYVKCDSYAKSNPSQEAKSKLISGNFLSEEESELIPPKLISEDSIEETKNKSRSKVSLLQGKTKLTSENSFREEKSMFDRPCELTGYIYHILPDMSSKKKMPCRSMLCCCCLCLPDIPPKCTVYRSSIHTFENIRVASSMLKDHLPYNYSLQELNIEDFYAD